MKWATVSSAVALVLSLACAPLVATAAGLGASDKPVKALIAAMQSDDAPGIRAQFAANATQAYGANGLMKTAQATAQWLETDVIQRRGKVANAEFSVSGNEVVVRGDYTSMGYASKADFLFVVNDGLIVSWRIRY